MAWEDISLSGRRLSCWWGAILCMPARQVRHAERHSEVPSRVASLPPQRSTVVARVGARTCTGGRVVPAKFIIAGIHGLTLTCCMRTACCVLSALRRHERLCISQIRLTAWCSGGGCAAPLSASKVERLRWRRVELQRRTNGRCVNPSLAHLSQGRFPLERAIVSGRRSLPRSGLRWSRRPSASLRTRSCTDTSRTSSRRSRG